MKDYIYKWTCPKCGTKYEIEYGAGLNKKQAIPLKNKFQVNCIPCKINKTINVTSNNYKMKKT